MSKLLYFLILVFLVGFISAANCEYGTYYQLNVTTHPGNSLAPDYCYVYGTDGEFLQGVPLYSDGTSNVGEVGFTGRKHDASFDVVCMRNTTAKCTSCSNYTFSLSVNDFKLYNTQSLGDGSVCYYSYFKDLTFKCATSKTSQCSKTTPTPKPKATVTATTIPTVTATETTTPDVTETPTPEPTVETTKISTSSNNFFSQLFLGFLVSGPEDLGLNCMQKCIKNYNVVKKQKGKAVSFLCYYNVEDKNCVYN